MQLKKQLGIALILWAVCCRGLFAGDIMDTYFDTDELNNRIRQYIVNVSNLIPDSTTLQNVWSYIPEGEKFWWGAGLNVSFTILERRLISGVLKGAEGFGDKQEYNDLSQFPTAIPYLPGVSFDLRGGMKRFDVGLCGMWLENNKLADWVGSFIGENNHFTYKMFGFDVRYLLLEEKGYIPAVTVQGGYYFTWMSFGISAGDYNTEKVNAEFRNDSYLLAAQASYKLAKIIRPYLGLKVIISKTDSSFSWETHRPVMVKGQPYPDGAIYESGATDGELHSYFQITGGIGLILIQELPDIITIGGAYNVVTNHFGLNISARFIPFKLSKAAQPKKKE
jgi:hypothetical protein